MTRLLAALRVVPYAAAFFVICVYCDVLVRTWCLLATRGRPDERVRRGNLLVRHWGVALTQATFRLMGMRLDVDGRAPAGRFVVVSNHQSTADIALVIWALRGLDCKFVAKDELGRFKPFVSVALRELGSAIVSTDSPSREDVARLRDMARGLASWGGSAVVFAEGTRSRDGRVLPYKKAAIRILAEETRLPLLPLAIDGTHVAADLPGFVTGLAGARFRMTIGEPVPPERWEGRIEEAVDEIREWTVRTLETGRALGT